MEAASSSSSSSAPTPLHAISDPVAVRILASSADVALVLDREGTVVDLWVGSAFEDPSPWRALIGESWRDTVMRDSRAKVDQLVGASFTGQLTRPREINQRVEGLGELPIRFSGALVDDEHVVALGKDIRPLAEMQQRIVAAQQAMDAEYRRLRQADTRYRVLFHVCAEGVVIADADRAVLEANPAAAELLSEPVGAIRGKALHELFAPDSRDALHTLLGAVEAGGHHEVALRPRGKNAPEVTASAAMFRQAGSSLMLLRFWPTDAAPSASARDLRMLRVMESMPEGFVVTNEELEILSANSGFCELVQRANEGQVVGSQLGRWVGRPGVDLNLIVASLRELGVVREFATIVRGEFDVDQEALVTAVSALDGAVPSYGFVIRAVTSRVVEPETSAFLPRSVDKLQGLVGRVSLKEIVRESTDMIERLCIEAALDVSRNNRAAAAQLLGLSRQGLYSKLRRHGIAEFDPPSS